MNRTGTIHIVEDGIDITENDYLVDFEIEDNCYVNDKIIGTTVSKKITVNILNPDNNINLEDKEVIVNVGIVRNGEKELVPFGNFIIEKPINEETKQNTKFVGYDYMIKFNKKYEDTSTYPITLKEYLKKLCEQVGVELGSTSLVNGEYKIQGNPFTNNEDCKTVLSNVAQLCGGFAHIGRDNKLYIINLGGETQEIIDGNNYFSFEKNDQYGEVNSLVVKLSQVEGENTAREDASSINTNGLTEITIADNYFLNSAEEREKVIDTIFGKINGLKYIPINCSYYGYPYLDAGDAITVLDTKDIEHSTYVLNHKFKYNGGFSGNIESTALTKTQTAYKNNVDLKTKFQNVEFKVDKINGSITQVISNVSEQNQKISEVTQTVNELNSKISDIADITTSKESTNGTVSFEKINQSEPIYVRIYPTGINISYLYPHANLYPSETLYPKVRTLRFTNTTTNEHFDYELPIDLLYYNAENYDEFILDYDAQSCVVNKRVGYNADGTTYALDAVKTIEYEYPRIELTDGDYVITLLGYHNAYLFVRLMAQNMYTTQFATKAELNSEISQTSKEIKLSVDEKLTSYPTTTQMNSVINVKADSITSSVSRTYATKTENNNTLNSAKGYTDAQVITAKSEIKQTTDSIQAQVNSNDKDISTLTQTANSISSEVSKKVGNNEIISKINQSAETVQIDANKISLNGKTINLTSDNTVIQSNNFSVDKYGNMNCKNANITGGKINVLGDGNGRDVIKITSLSNSNEYTSLMPMGLTSTGTNGSVDVFCSGSNSDGSHISLYDQDGYAYYGTDRIKCMSIFDKQTTSMTPNLRVDSTGEFLRSTNTSSKRYKTNIKNVEKTELDVHKLYDLPVRQFKYKKDYFKNTDDIRYDTELIGFIAEEVAEIYPIATDYEKDKNGNKIIENWNERYIIPAMLKLIQEQHEDIKQLQKEIKELKERE